ncbi:hypothetical protein BH11ARM2_BH11ARM2_15210 [soil metagenome]
MTGRPEPLLSLFNRGNARLLQFFKADIAADATTNGRGIKFQIS